MQQLLKEIEKKLSHSAVVSLAKPVVEHLQTFPLNAINVQGKGRKKENRENEIEKFLRKEFIYEAQTNLLKPYNEYTNSIVLIMNERPLQLMILEVAEMCLMIDKISKIASKCSRFPELKAFYDNFNTEVSITSGQLMDALVEDLSFYALKYNFSFNRTSFNQDFKDAQKALKGAKKQ